MPAARSLLRPPTVPRSALARPSLERRLDDVFGARLATVVAGSGFGKTTAVAAWAADLDCIWLTLTPADGGFARLASRLAEIIEVAAGGEALPPLPQTADTATPEHAETVAAALTRALGRRLDHDVVIVLDDVHEVEGPGPAADLLGAFCRHLPEGGHLVLVSRLEPPFRTARLRGRGELIEVEAPDLAFSADEVLELCSRILGDADAELASAVHSSTAGWPAAVRLVLERLRKTPPAERQRALWEVPETLIDYLVQEVLEREPAATRELMRVLAPFQHLSAELAGVLGIEDATRRLESLVRRGLLVVRHEAASASYSLHTLVRDLAPDLLDLDGESTRALRVAAARWHAAGGDFGAALDLAVLAEDTAEIAALLAEHGRELAAGASAETVVRAARLLGDTPLDSRGELAAGDALAARGDWAQALARYQRASAGNTDVPAGIAWRIGRIHFDQGCLDDALRAYSRGRLDGDDVADRALLLAWTASCRWSRGERAEARALAEKALVAAEEADEPHALAVAHNVLLLLALGSDPARVTSHFEAGIAAAERVVDPGLVIRLRANRATQLVADGALEEALATITPALDAAELAGGGLHAAFPLLKRGEIFLRLGRLEDAVADFRAAQEIYERYGSLRRYGALVNLADAYLIRGDVVPARSALEEALRVGETSRDAQLELFSSVSLARALAFDAPERARHLVRQASDAASRLGFGRELTLLAEGWVALVRQARSEAARAATDAKVEAARRGARPALAEALVLAALSSPDPADEIASLEQAAEISREIGDTLSEATVQLLRARLAPGVGRETALAAERVLRALGVRLAPAGRVAGALAFLPAERPPEIEIRTLGSFAVLRRGHPVPLAAWKSRQARDLLKLLVARRGRTLPRDQAMAALWPEREPSEVSGRFSFVLSTLRSVLEPERSRGAPSLVETNGDALRLRIEQVDVDVETFLRHSERSLARDADDALLELAEAMYGGDFLEEDAYADWAVPLREQARAAYIAVARTLAERRRKAGDHGVAGRYLLRILERDAYDEHAHLHLVASLEASGAHGEARRAYRRYVAAMAELGIEPVPYPRTGRTSAGAA